MEKQSLEEQLINLIEKEGEIAKKITVIIQKVGKTEPTGIAMRVFYSAFSAAHEERIEEQAKNIFIRCLKFF